MNSTTSRRIASVGVALTLLLAAMGGALAAPTVDSETTTTTSTSELTDGTTQATFNASDDVQLPTLQASYATTNPALQVVDPATGEVIVTYKNATDPDYFTSTGGTGPYYFNTTLNESDLATVPMDANQNKSVTLRLFDNGSQMDVSTSTNVTVFLENTGERAVVHAGSTATGDSGIAEVDEMELSWAQENIFNTDAANTSVLEADSVGVNGSDTDVFVVYADDSVAEPYEDAAEEKSSFWGLRTSDYEDGDKILDHVVFVEDNYYYSYSSSAPEDVADNEDATFAEYTTLNGEPTHKIVLGDEDFEDETSVDVMTKGNLEADLGYFEDIKSYEDGGILSSFGMQMSAVPGLTGSAAA